MWLFYTKVEKGLNCFARCATGNLASDIVGKNLYGKTMRLNDPHILWVNPEGRIVAKELRGEELVKTVEHFVTQP
ncbi:hypothetical protein EVA_01829 [gut metagenome]|uniref:Uncharacterized protein n=1 Tax=gut metagenome TaxID=749906 RepID=J9GPE2_9ZZZZ